MTTGSLTKHQVTKRYPYLLKWRCEQVTQASGVQSSLVVNNQDNKFYAILIIL
jgi:hypothetical protein